MFKVPVLAPVFTLFVFLAGVALPSPASADSGGADPGSLDSGSHQGDGVHVDEVLFPVELSDGNTYQIAGYMYYVGTPQSPILQVAVHGATHFHLYWDRPRINGVSYSYARYMARRGYTVLAIDQLGTGASSQPDGDFVTLDETASALHQVLASADHAVHPGHGVLQGVPNGDFLPRADDRSGVHRFRAR